MRVWILKGMTYPNLDSSRFVADVFYVVLGSNQSEPYAKKEGLYPETERRHECPKRCSMLRTNREPRDGRIYVPTVVSDAGRGVSQWSFSTKARRIGRGFLDGHPSRIFTGQNVVQGTGQSGRIQFLRDARRYSVH